MIRRPRWQSTPGPGRCSDGHVIEPWLYPLLTTVAVLAGFVDAIAGGGGLIMMPALLVSGVPPLNALGTNKLQSMCGTFVAMRNYGAKGLIEWRRNLPTVAVVFVGSASGVLLVQQVKAETLAFVIPVLLLGNALYILLSPRMTDEDAHHRVTSAQYAPVGGAIGFYDGFVGPGTGSFLVFLLVGVVGLSFLHASATAKVVNTMTNLATLALFAAGGHVLWALGAAMALANLAGSQVGARLAIARGSAWVRTVFVVVVSALVLRLAYDVLL